MGLHSRPRVILSSASARGRPGPVATRGTTLAVKIASVLPVIAATIDRGQISATTARVLVDQNSAGFVITFLTFGIFMVGVGLAVLDSGVLGRVAGWLAVVIESAFAVSFDVNPVSFLRRALAGLRAPRRYARER